MAKPVYLYNDYKRFILDRFAREECGGRGQRQKLARFLHCQDSYISLVLSGERHFSVEQGEGTARFLRLNAEETEVFLCLLLLARAGTPESRKYFSSQLERLRARFLHLRSRVKIESELSDADKAVYYSNPLHAKIHMCLTIPGELTAEALAKKFRASLPVVERACRFLAARGLIQENAGRYSRATKFLFVDKNSPFLPQHHVGWRMDAIHNIQENREDSLHLSMTFSLSEKDASDLRLKIAQFISTASSQIKESKEEKLMVLCLDYYDPAPREHSV